MEAPIPNPSMLVPVCVRAVAAWKLRGLDQGLRNSSGSLAMFAAIRHDYTDLILIILSIEPLWFKARPVLS
jgi:hypothetical protein